MPRHTKWNNLTFALCSHPINNQDICYMLSRKAISCHWTMAIKSPTATKNSGTEARRRRKYVCQASLCDLTRGAWDSTAQTLLMTNWVGLKNKHLYLVTFAEAVWIKTSSAHDVDTVHPKSLTAVIKLMNVHFACTESFHQSFAAISNTKMQT